MEKFLRIPVTNEQTQLVPATDVLLVAQATTTTVTILYKGGVQLTLTHATAGAGVETERDAIQDAIEAVLKQPWNDPIYVVGRSGYIELPFAVSGIAAAFIDQPTGA
tara:strand:- start:253 stop:573 length:321 start_codon:yes stop_codon:yes gene_type:complete